jgi:hypothetical protein
LSFSGNEEIGGGKGQAIEAEAIIADTVSIDDF